MKNLFLVMTIIFSQSAFANEIQATHICLDPNLNGYAFNTDLKKAWQVANAETRNGIDIMIYPDEFIIYRCPGCFSFKGYYEINNELRQVYAFTHLNTLKKELWMFYLTQNAKGETVQATIPCIELQ